MEFLLSFLKTVANLILGDIFDKNRIYREKAFEFKEILTKDLPVYENPKTTLSAAVLQYFPNHNAAFRKLLLYVPGKKHEKYISEWEKYEQIYNEFKQYEEFGPVMAILPDKDFQDDPKYLNSTEQKFKKVIINVCNYFIKKL